MSQTTHCHNPTPSIRADLSKALFQVRAHDFQERDITHGLIAGLYGVLVVLCIQSIYALMRRRKRQVATIVLSLTILALFTSTTMFVVVTFIYNEAFSQDALLQSAAELWSFDPPIDFDYLRSARGLQKDYTMLYQRTGTAAILINVILGDAIVWWRTCVVWNRNIAVWAVCGVVLTATFVLGVLDATLSSGNGYNGSGFISLPGLSGQTGVLFEDNSFGVATCLLSLTTNLVATLLIVFKAWKSRMRLKGYLVAKARGPSQVEKLLSILIESGAVYCAIWVVVVAYQTSVYNYYVGSAVSEASNTAVKFLDIFGLIMGGALVPLTAIYPTIVIVLVASSTRSHMEQGLTVDVRTSRLIAVADTVTIGHAEIGLRRRSNTLLLEGTRHDSGSEDSEENVGMDASEEWKLERAHHISKQVPGPNNTQ